MLKDLKALIRMEFRSNLFMIVGFLVIYLLGLVFLQVGLMNTESRYLYGGVSEIYDGIFMQEIYLNVGVIVSFSVVALLVVPLIQFKNDKNHNIARFLKSLPYTERQRAGVKVGMGLVGFTLPYTIYAVGIVATYYSALHRFKYMLEVTALGRYITQLFSVDVLIKYLLLAYLAGISIYMVGILFQYLIRPRGAAVVVAILVYLAPFFLLGSSALYNTGIAHKDWYIECLLWIGQVMNPFSIIEYKYSDLGCGIPIVYLAKYKIVFWLVIFSISSFLVFILSKRQLVETADYFISNNIFRVIFIVGVTLCGGNLLVVLPNIFGTTFGIFRFTWVISLIGNIISGAIAYKISNIGRKRKGIA